LYSWEQFTDLDGLHDLVWHLWGPFFRSPETTVSKIRGLMHRVYKVGILHERVEKNPVEHVETRSQSLYKAVIITPLQTLSILNTLTNPLHYTLVLTCAATALRASEIISLRWSDILWSDGQIRVSKRWAKGEDGETKTAASNGYVPMHPVLAQYLEDWRAQSPYSKVNDFVFPSLVKDGKVPIWASIFVRSHLRPAAIGAGVVLAKEQRFGLHNLRHSLSNWLVNKAKVEPKTVQGILRHSKIQTTLDLYTQDDRDEKQTAQGAFLSVVGLGRGLVQ
jgi:integrase